MSIAEWEHVELVVDIHASLSDGDLDGLLDALAKLSDRSPEDAAALTELITPRLRRLRSRAAA